MSTVDTLCKQSNINHLLADIKEFESFERRAPWRAFSLCRRPQRSKLRGWGRCALAHPTQLRGQFSGCYPEGQDVAGGRQRADGEIGERAGRVVETVEIQPDPVFVQHIT